MEVPKSLENHGTAKLYGAVLKMREACDQADRDIKHGATDLEKARAVLHTFVWAWANAQMDVEACLSHVERWQVTNENTPAKPGR
jgi:uncharacterized protein (DUF983 family)